MRPIVCGVVFLVCAQGMGVQAPATWPDTVESSRPWTYWWWMGSAVDEPNLDWCLDSFADAGLGGVHVIPIYGVHGAEPRFLDFLSPQWTAMLRHTIGSAAARNLGVDMSTGTGWPFGGPQVTPEMMATKATVEKFMLDGGQRSAQPLTEKSIACVTGYGPNGAVEDLTAHVTEAKILDWTAPDGTWTVYVMMTEPTGQQVKRAAPGAQGHVLDPFSVESLEQYVQIYDEALGGGPWPRGQYHDSYEYYGANWTDAVFERFESMHGYDVRAEVAALSGDGDPATVAAVRHDYRATIAALLHAYTAAWVEWAHGHGGTTRNQAHGSPGNLLDLYARADIPETEIFGPSGFPIPGLRTSGDVPDGARPNPLVMKFASSAAHIMGRPLVSSETCTWMAEHFQEALSQAKPQVDEMLLAGINHIFYHGIAYSPRDAAWPGWLFYASTNFGPTSPFFRDFRAFNDYVARCQAMLRDGRPDNDILLYFPIHDVWHEAETPNWIRQLGVHSIDWLNAGGFLDAATILHDAGYAFDYVSDAMLESATVDASAIVMPGDAYRTLVLPDCRYLTAGTAARLLALAERGATILSLSTQPPRAPGLHADDEQRALDALLASLTWRETGAVFEAARGHGRVIRGADLRTLLDTARVPRETMADLGLSYTRRRTDDGNTYFIGNLGNGLINHWVTLARPAASALLMDPMHIDRIGAAATRMAADAAQIYLQLRPGESVVVRTLDDAPAPGTPWLYTRPSAIAPVDGPWDLAFLEGGPTLPANATIATTASWTTLDDDAAKAFSGTARYSTSFDVPEPASAAEWTLDLGDVRESARVRVNGHDVATLVAIPFRVSIGNFVKPGINSLDVEITSTGANRIADMDRRDVPWKIFHEINYVNIKYKPFDASGWAPVPSGLLGPVRIEAAQPLDPAASAPGVEALAEVAPGWRGEIIASLDQSNVGWDVEIGDADNDGSNEILVTGCPDSRLYMLKRSGQGWITRLLAQDLARRAPEPGMGLTVKVVDLNGDGRNEIIVGTGQEGMSAGPAYFYVMKCDGSAALVTAVTQATMAESLYTHNFGVADIDDDGVQEVLSAYCGTGEIMRYDFNADLSEITGRQLHVHAGSGEDSFIADIDNDGDFEYLTADCYREGEARIHIFEFDSQGELIKPARIVIDGYDDVKCFNVSLEVGDIDNDGALDLIAIWKERSDENTGTILGYTIDQSGASVTHTFAKRDPALDLGYGEKMMCVADADNDGANELVVSTRGETQWQGGGLGHVILYELDEGEIRQTLLLNFHPGAADASWVAVGDADNDGQNEVIVATGVGHRERPGISHVVMIETRATAGTIAR